MKNPFVWIPAIGIVTGGGLLYYNRHKLWYWNKWNASSAIPRNESNSSVVTSSPQAPTAESWINTAWIWFIVLVLFVILCLILVICIQGEWDRHAKKALLVQRTTNKVPIRGNGVGAGESKHKQSSSTTLNQIPVASMSSLTSLTSLKSQDPSRSTQESCRKC